MIASLEKTIFIAGYIKMNNNFKKTIEMFTLPWKLIVALGIVISLFVGLYTVDNRFAKAEQLTTLETHIDKDMDGKFLLAEAQSVKTFQGIQMQQVIMNKALQLQILHIQKDSLDKEYWSLKRSIRKNPNDLEMQEELDDVKIQRQLIKERIDKKILEK